MITKENAKIHRALSIKAQKENTVKRIKEAVFSLFHENEKITYRNLSRKFKISNNALTANKDLIAEMKESLLGVERKEVENKFPLRKTDIELAISILSNNSKQNRTDIQIENDVYKGLNKLYIDYAYEHNEKLVKDALDICHMNKDKIKNFFSYAKTVIHDLIKTNNLKSKTTLSDEKACLTTPKTKYKNKNLSSCNPRGMGARRDFELIDSKKDDGLSPARREKIRKANELAKSRQPNFIRKTN